MRLTPQQPAHIAYHFSLLPQACNQRLDQAITSILTDYSRSVIQTWIKQGHVTVNQQPCKPKQTAISHQCISIQTTMLDATPHWKAEPLPLSIITEDMHVIVINKPAGLTVHPGAGQPNHTLANALLHHDPTLKHLPRAGLIHRLDQQTSGLLVIARTHAAYQNLTRQMQARTIKRNYDAFVIGNPISAGTIDHPIGRHPTQRTRMSVREDGRQAITHFNIVERFRAHTHLNVSLETGRTHQIRVHLTHVGYPLIGDPHYPTRAYTPPSSLTDALKDALKRFERQALHASSLSFQHPHTGKKVHYKAPLPQDLNDLREALRLDVLRTC